MRNLPWLKLAAVALIIGALAHVVGYVMGPEAIEFLGAPPGIVQSARDGTMAAPLSTFAIAGLLLALAGVAFKVKPAGEGHIVPRVFLWVFAFVFTLRGLLIFMFLPAIFKVEYGDDPFKFWFHVFASLFVLFIGAALAIGLSRTKSTST